MRFHLDKFKRHNFRLSTTSKHGEDSEKFAPQTNNTNYYIQYTFYHYLLKLMEIVEKMDAEMADYSSN